MELGEYSCGPNDKKENGIYIGDAKKLTQRIPDSSVDLIFTDPVYYKLEDYEWLASVSNRILKPDGVLLVWQATPLMSKTVKLMEPPLNYVWTMHMQKYGPCYPGKPGICVISQCYWFDKADTSSTHTKIADWYGAAQGGLKDNTHKWSKPKSVIMHWVDAFTAPRDIVFDPFTGGGTVPVACKQLGRRWCAFEINSRIAQDTRARLKKTQPPLFTDTSGEAKQLDLGAEITSVIP